MNLNTKSLEKLRELINEEIEYRSGSKIVSFFNEFGFNDSYGQGFPSRWFFTDEKLKQINNSLKLKECILKLFNPINFIGKNDKLKKFISEFNQYLQFDDLMIELNSNQVFIVKYKEQNNNVEKKELSENDFLNQEFLQIDMSKLNLDYSFEEVIKQRLKEIELSLKNGASLSVIFLCGSTLEGLLLNIATQNPQDFNKSKSAPKSNDGKVKALHDWTLDSLINVSYDVGIIKLDIKKFSHTLKDFRNYIHPKQQASQKFNPDKHTAEISWKVLQATIANLIGDR
jgi:hypothetical protein